MRTFWKIPVILVILFVCTLMVPPCTAESSDILLSQGGSMMDWCDAHIDNNLIAIYVSSSSPPAIEVYNSDGTLYHTIPLTNETTDIESLAISEGRVYYTEYDTSVAWDSRTETVYEYDLATGDKRIIYSTPPLQRITRIAADGDYVVLRGGVNDEELILHTISAGTDRILFSSHSWIMRPTIDGDRIVWGCERTDREPGREIHVYTISTGEDDIIEESKSIKTWGFCEISGDRVVWIRAAEEPDTSLGYPRLTTAGGDICLTNLSTGNTCSIEIIGVPDFPHISGNMVAYIKKPEVDYDNPNTGTIRTYDINTDAFSDVASEVAVISNVDNGQILWKRYSPELEVWLTALPGAVPAATSPSSPEAATQTSPGNPFTVIVALTTGIAGYVAIRRR